MQSLSVVIHSSSLCALWLSAVILHRFTFPGLTPEKISFEKHVVTYLSQEQFLHPT